MYKPIHIEDEIKQHISIVLKYYRSFQKIKQSDFILYNNASVCSADTYSRIENGKVIKRNSIYTYLLYQIDATYECFPSFWNNELPKFQQLVRTLTMYQMEDYRNLCEQIKSDFHGSKDFLAREIYSLLDISLQYFDTREMLERDMFEKYREIYKIFPKPIQEILKTMLYQNAFYHQRNIPLCKKIFYEMHMEESTSPFVRIDQCRQYFFEERYLDSHAIALRLEELFIKEKNYQRLLDVYEVLLLLYRKVQTNDTIRVYLLKFFQLIQEHSENFHPTKQKQGLLIAGIMHYYQNDVEEAYACFSHLITLDKAYYLPAALFMNIVVKQGPYEGAQMLEPIKNKESYPSYIVSFYQYFIDRHQNCTNEYLENLLVKQVLPYCSPSDMLYWEPLKEELLSLIKDTKHYYIKKKLMENSD
ncbi:hypothetical protein ACWG0P_09825 [Amedibacillus sp. YH-ame6]